MAHVLYKLSYLLGNSIYSEFMFVTFIVSLMVQEAL